MNWSRAKSIFLVTFLVLDLFLGYQLYNKRQNADNVLLNGTASPQKRMKVSLISWPDHLPTIKSAAYLKGTSMSFVTESTVGGSDAGGNDSKTGSGSGKGGQTEKLGNGDNGTNAVKKVHTVQKRLIKEVRDLETINGQKVQNIKAREETTIVSTLVKPVEVNLDTSEPFKDFLKNDVYKGSEYTIWKQGGENSPYILVQTFNDCPVFSKGQSEAASSGGQFPSGTLKISVKNGKIAGYEQSYLSLSTYQKKKDLIAPLNKAVFSLYKNDDILNNSTVKLIHLSYYNLIESDSDLGKVRLFVPTWHILVEENKTGKQKEFFVNAITSGILTPIKQEQTGG